MSDPLVARKPLIVRAHDLLGLLLRRIRGSMQVDGVDDRTYREPDRVAVIGHFVFEPGRLDVLGRCDPVNAARIRDAVHVEAVHPRGTAMRARFLRIRFEPVTCAAGRVLRGELDEPTDEMWRLG